MDGTVAYSSPNPPHHHHHGHHHHQPSSFGIDNILTGVNIGGGGANGSPMPPVPHLAPAGGHTHYGGCDTSVSSMILRKIDPSNDTKRESVSSTDDDEEGFRKKKKPRTAFSREQVAELEKKFTEKKYLSSAERGELAEKLKLSDMQVKTWFQNRRMKYKRQTEEAEMELKSPKYPYGPFVPYPSIYGYMSYKATDYNGGGGAGGGVYSPSALHSCSQQYSSAINSPDSFSNGYAPSPVISPMGGVTHGSVQRYSPNHQHRVDGVFFNRGGGGSSSGGTGNGASPLSSPSTPVSSYSSNAYFNGAEYGGGATIPQFSE